jgi:spore photoproduct lyase
MDLFMPERVFFDPASLEYPLGQELYTRFSKKGLGVLRLPLRSVSSHIPGKTGRELYAGSKKTLVITIKKGNTLESCKPSADYEFPLYTNCPGSCEYCYLQTTQGARPYIRAYVNLEDIFDTIRDHAEKSGKPVTTFEAASSGDPLAIEHLTGSLSKTIEFFGTLENARLRLVTKYSSVDPLLALKHNGHTRFRFSINSRYVIDNFEHNTASYEQRIEAASKMSAAQYPIGFIVAPIMIYNGWEEEYANLFSDLAQRLDMEKINEPVTFELIQHRFTPVAKNFILDRFPNTKLDMNEESRSIKWGKFGRFKYVYPKEKAAEMKDNLSGLVHKYFPSARIDYFT